MSLTDYVRGHEAGLLQGQTVGESLERERIIKLLWERFDCGNPNCIHDECCFVEETIALIKGEQK